MLEDDTTVGQTFELYGPREYALADIAAIVDREIIKKRRRINVPRFLLKPAAEVASRLIWYIEMCGDEIERQFIDQEIDPKAKTFKDLGIKPSDIGEWTYTYLVSCVPSEMCSVGPSKNIPSNLHLRVSNIYLRTNP